VYPSIVYFKTTVSFAKNYVTAINPFVVAVLGKGIKNFSVGADGVDKQGEFIQHQMAQFTGGRFVFLSFDKASNPASSPGGQTVHIVQNYSVAC
jgi:hypothetical protein